MNTTLIGKDYRVWSIEEIAAANKVLAIEKEKRTKLHVVITATGGIVEGASVFRDEAIATAFAKHEWTAMNGSPEPNPEWDGYHSDDHDVWQFEETLDEHA